MLNKNYETMNKEIYRRLIYTLTHDLYSHKVLYEIGVMAGFMADFQFLTWQQNKKIQDTIKDIEKNGFNPEKYIGDKSYD